MGRIYTSKELAKQHEVTVRAIQHHAEKWSVGFKEGRYLRFTEEDAEFIANRIGKLGAPPKKKKE